MENKVIARMVIEVDVTDLYSLKQRKNDGILQVKTRVFNKVCETMPNSNIRFEDIKEDNIKIRRG